MLRRGITSEGVGSFTFVIGAVDKEVMNEGRAMRANVEIPTTLRPSRRKMAVLFVLCLLFVLGGIFMIRHGDKWGYLCCGVFGLGLPVFGLQFHPQAAYLHLAPEGFTICCLFRAYTVRWGDVRKFGVVTIALNKMVGLNFRPEYVASGRARGISKELSGYEGALPDTYGMKVQELVDLMERLRQEYGDKGLTTASA
jgi:hypothetical protein